MPELYAKIGRLTCSAIYCSFASGPETKSAIFAARYITITTQHDEYFQDPTSSQSFPSALDVCPLQFDDSFVTGGRLENKHWQRAAGLDPWGRAELSRKACGSQFHFEGRKWLWHFWKGSEPSSKAGRRLGWWLGLGSCCSRRASLPPSAASSARWWSASSEPVWLSTLRRRLRYRRPAGTLSRRRAPDSKL